MDWREVTDDLYHKISPIRGDLNSQIESDFISTQKINAIWIEFDMNEFIYQDPFYGEQLSTSPFRMYVNPLKRKNGIQITHIQELENKQIEDSRTVLKGAFSNSLHFSAPLIKFGAIKGNKIEFEMEYCLTNSDSYGMMTGTIDEHVQSSGNIKLDLEIRDMLILVSKGQNVNEILKSMNPNIYDIKATKEATDTNITYNNYNQFRVPYKNIKLDIPKQPWWKLN
jgi:hypothetical protein